MAIPVEEVLSLWRELERRRDELPTVSLERQRLNQEIEKVRRLYARITTDIDTTDAKLDSSDATIARARRVLDDAHSRTRAKPRRLD